MREILYRGKRLDNGEWVEGYCATVNPVDMPSVVRKPKTIIFSEKSECNWFNKYFFNAVEVDPKTVGQYTGQKDKNESRIYEGDIVYWGYEDDEGVIRWDDDQSRFYGDFPLVFADFDNFYGYELEVVGNIHD